MAKAGFGTRRSSSPDGSMHGSAVSGRFSEARWLLWPELQAKCIAPESKDYGGSKEDLSDGLERATKNTTKGTCHKTRHAFEILALIDPAILRQRCLHAEAL